MKTEYIVEYKPQTSIDDVYKANIVRDAMEEFDQWINATSDKREKSYESRCLYFDNKPENLSYTNANAAVDPTNSNVRLPALAQALDGCLAQQHLASFPASERFYQLNPLNAEAQDIKSLYEKRMQSILTEIDFLSAAYKDRKNLMLDGTSCVYHPYIRKSKNRVSYNRKEILGIKMPWGEPKREQKEEVMFEGTAFIPLNFNDWVFDPLVDCIDNGSFIWRRFVCKADIMNNEEFDNLSILKDEHDSKNPHMVNDNAGSWKLDGIQLEGIADTYQDTASDNDQVLLYEKWGDFYIDDEYYQNHVLIWSGTGRQTFHYFGPNPWDHGCKPFSINAYIPSAGTLYGKSQAHDVIPLCNELDTLINTLNDILHVTARPTFTYLVSDMALQAFFEGQPVALRPGEGIPVGTHESIRPLVWPLDSINEIIGAMQRIKEEIRESTGGVPYTTGGAHEQDQDRTLGEVEILASGTNVRFQMVIQDYEILKLRRWLIQSFENDRQLMSKPQVLQPTQKQESERIKELEVLTPNMVKMSDFDFDVTGSRSVLTRNRDINELDAFIQNYVPGLVQSGAAELSGGKIAINLSEMIKARLKLTNALRNTEQFITEIDPNDMQEPGILGQGGMPPQGQPGLPEGIPPQMLMAMMAQQQGQGQPPINGGI